MSEVKPRDLLTYVRTFKDRLQNACEIVNNNLKQTQKDMKSRYDKNTKVRVFKPGDKVLIFLPIQGRPLNARYQGPYEIESCQSPLNYLVKTPDRRKSKQLCHVNMIKMYHCRVPDGTDKQGHNVSLVVNTSDNDNTLDGTEIGHDVRLKNSEILAKIEEKMRHLDTMQKDELSQLITEYSDLFPDAPTKTTAVYHDVEIRDALPIKQHPYRVNPLKLDAMREEINYMLENDIIEPSNSDFSSPSMLVSKPDGTYRFVTNFKAVNAITKCDSYPIPRIEDCIDKIGQAKYVSKFDLLKGFWQVPLTERAKRVSAFATPDGLYQYRVMPFGMRNSPATFQRLINRVISGLNIIDYSRHVFDLGIYVSTDCSFEFHITNLNKRTKHLPGWILRTFSSRDKLTMLTLFKALVMSRLDYGSQLWSSHLTKHINMIDKTQRSFSGYISGMQGLSYPERLTVLKLYSLQRRRERYIIIYVWKILEYQVPNLSPPIRFRTSDRRGRACITPHVGVGRLGTLAYNSFRWRAIRMLNQLTLFLRNTTVCSVYSFKKKLDLYLSTVPDGSMPAWI